MTTTYTAFAAGSDNTLGADAGISIFRRVVEAGQVMEEGEIITWTGTEIDDESGELDTDAAERQLGYLGWQPASAGWVRSGDGQMAIEVAPWGDGRPVTGLCGARPYPPGSEGDDGTVCMLPAGHTGPHDDAPARTS